MGWYSTTWGNIISHGPPACSRAVLLSTYVLLLPLSCSFSFFCAAIFDNVVLTFFLFCFLFFLQNLHNQQSLCWWDMGCPCVSQSGLITTGYIFFQNIHSNHPISYHHRDQFGNAPSQWEMMLHCNVISYWLGAQKKWSLLSHQVTATHLKIGQWIFKWD